MKWFLLITIAWTELAVAKIKVVTTTTNLKSVVEEIGKDKVEVHSFSKGSQDPHFLEAKPSYMVKASRADLLVQIGLGLEQGWLPLIIRGARNPKLKPGESGHLFASQGIDLIEEIEGTVTRADGDVHPEGNPHFMLDPIRASKVAVSIANKLSILDSKNKKFYFDNAEAFKDKMQKIADSGKKLLKGKNNKIITFHKTLNYFNARFGLKNLAYLEPKPGVPPTASHIIKVIKIAQTEKPGHILVENYFDPTVGERVIRDLKESEYHLIPVSVEGEKNIDSLSDLYIKLLRIISHEAEWTP